MILHPSFILRQGKHKGYTLAEVYQYDPKYIDWMVEFIQDFEITIDEFYSLPNPTVFVAPPLPSDYKTRDFSEIVECFYKQDLTASVGVLKQTKDLKTIDFKFLDKTIEILSEKRNGTYKAPKWEYPILGNVISFDDIKNLD